MPPGVSVQVLPRLELLFEADPTVLASLRQQSVRWLRRLRWPEAPIANAVTALDAAVSNSVEHAYCGPGGQISVHALAVSQRSGRSAARFAVCDRGRWKIPDPSRTGYGLLLMDKLSEELYIETGSGGTTVVLTTPTVVLA